MFEFQLVASLQSLKVFFHFPDFTGAYGTSLIAPLILKLDKVYKKNIFCSDF